MTPGLSDRDRKRFEELRERLADVHRAPESLDDRPTPGPIDPMLATTFDGSLADVDESDFIAERKYDGTRLILEKFDDAVSMFTRRHIERSDTLPALGAVAMNSLPNGIILDGEYTFVRSDGTVVFLPLHTDPDRIDDRGLEPRYFVFDVIAYDGTWCVRQPLMERRSILEAEVPESGTITIAPYWERDFETVYDGFVDRGEEGIMLKRRSSGYHPGTRSEHWKKVKAFTEADVIIVGYTEGEGSRSATFGALVMTDGESYVGKVGSGFSDAELRSISARMTPTGDAVVSAALVGDPYVSVEPFVVSVKYQEVTDSGTLRAPVFLREKVDKPIDDVTPVE